MKFLPRRFLVPLFVILLGSLLSACGGGGGSTLTVNSENDIDDGTCNVTHCSLREAIHKANTLSGTITIKFDIGGGGVQTIQVKSPLPAILVPVKIDGTTQPGYSFEPLIVLDGSLYTSGYADGLDVRGGTSTIYRLVIQSFNGRGISMQGPGENLILGCYIGTDVTGTIDRPNMAGGIRVMEGEKNVIGGTAASERNLISGNHGDGIQIQDIRTKVIGNYIGTDITGSTALKNIGSGVDIEAGLTIIGGSSAGEGNLISGNEATGITFQVGATDGFAMGNRIGTNAAGTAAIGNSWGITLHDNHNTIGGDTAAKRNVISGNRLDGIFINTPSEDNIIQGNYIGTDISGMAPLENQENGIQVAGNNNTIGGKLGTTGNVISANKLNGVTLDGVRNAVQGNLIGVNATGTAALGNQGHGVIANANLSLVGGTEAGNGNIISANTGDGVRVTSGAVLVQGNYIGTDITGTLDLGNGANGVYVFAAGSIQIGGSDPGAKNVISGNQLVGLFIEDGSDDVSVYGNFIGTNAAGMAPIKNIKAGIAAYGTNIQIGAAFDGGRNIISGNGGPGIAVVTTASGVKIQNNYIGTNVSGTVAIGNRNGIEAPMNPGSNILIGGDPADEGNLISGNQELGILLNNDVKVQGNKIGTDAAGTGPLGNGTHGIQIKGSGNLIGGYGFYNTIAFNGGAGVAVLSDFGGAVNNAIDSNSIHDNDGLGIAIDEEAVIPNDNLDPDTGDNNRQNYPVLTSAIADAVAMESTITGTLNSLPGTVFTIQIFTNASCDPSGNGEGHRLIRTMTVTTNIGGQALINALFPATYIDPANFVTATATDPAGNTSEFSNCIPVVDAASVTPTPAAMTFKHFFDPAEIFYGPRCTPDKVRLSVEIGNPPEPIAYVLLFARLMDKKTGEKTEWGGALTMIHAGKNVFYYDLSAYDVPDYTAFESAWLQYQFVVYNKAEVKIGYSEVYGDVAFTRCGANAPAVTPKPSTHG
jgi:CSLREA domain-containing protein